MPASKAYDKATKVTPVHGEVALDGPDGIGLSMTPAAARETARRLAEGADRAESDETSDDADED